MKVTIGLMFSHYLSGQALFTIIDSNLFLMSLLCPISQFINQNIFILSIFILPVLAYLLNLISFTLIIISYLDYCFLFNHLIFMISYLIHVNLSIFISILHFFICPIWAILSTFQIISSFQVTLHC